MKNDVIKVAMVDDHVLLRNALSSLINNSGKCKVIFEASNGKELIALDVTKKSIEGKVFKFSKIEY